MMTRQEKSAIVWGLNGSFYDSIMNRMPLWLTFTDDAEFDRMFDDWFFAEIGL